MLTGKWMTVLKVAASALSIGGTVLSGYLGKKEQESTIQKIVDETIKNKMGES